MRFLEKDLEQAIASYSIKDLGDRGLYIGRKIKKQVKLGNYGIADIIGVHSNYHKYNEDTKLVFTICELKRNKLSIGAFLQCVRYAKGLRRYLLKYKHSAFINHEIKIILIGDTLPEGSDLIYLPDLIHSQSNLGFSVELYTYKIDENGLRFTIHDNYKLKNEGF